MSDELDWPLKDQIANALREYWDPTRNNEFFEEEAEAVLAVVQPALDELEGALNYERDVACASIQRQMVAERAKRESYWVELQHHQAKMARVEALHVPCSEHPTCTDDDNFCHECGHDSPCTTRRAVLGDSDG